MTRHNTRKLSKICSEECYNWLQNWIKNLFPLNKYPLKPEDFFYKNKSHRQYLSKFIEQVIIKILKHDGNDPINAPDTGKYRDNSKIIEDVVGFKRTIGTGNWTKAANVRPGRADIKCFFKGNMYNMEVKVGKDRMSDDQKLEQTRAKKNKEIYVIIKTVDDFINLYENG